MSGHGEGYPAARVIKPHEPPQSWVAHVSCKSCVLYAQFTFIPCVLHVDVGQRAVVSNTTFLDDW